MNISEIQHGKITMIEVQRVDGTPLGLDCSICDEIELFAGTLPDEMLIKLGDEVRSVRGVNSRNNEITKDLISRNLPKLCWVASKYPKTGNVKRLSIQVHEFPTKYIWPNSHIRMGIDEKVVDHRFEAGAEVDGVVCECD